MYILENCKWTPYGTNPELDEYVNSDNWELRAEVAKQGYGLDKLINDEESYVRGEVAEQGYGLDILVNDEDWCVRQAVAEHGYGLDILINDKNKDVRSTVAEQGYGLDILINDDDYGVRSTVAEQGYGLDKLINDENEWVWTVVKMYLDRLHLTLSQWIKKYPNMCVLEHKYNQMEKVTKDFIYKIEESNKLEVQSYYDSIDEFFDLGVDYYTDCNTLEVCSVDTKIPLFEIEKFENNDKTEYKFIIDITNEQGDDFRVRTVIKSKEQLNKLIQQTIDALNIYPEFSKYVDDLENCII